MRRLLVVIEASLEAELSRFERLPLAAEICLRVQAAAGGRPVDGTPVALAALVCFLAFDLLDDLQDGDRRPWWDGFTRSELMLAAAAVPSVVVPGILLATTAETGLQAALMRTFSAGLAAVAEGQARDLAAMRASQLSPAEALAIIEGKAGAQMALYARLTALHARCSPERSDAFADAAHNIACTGQLGSDIIDLLNPQVSRDLASGARTLPVAHTLTARTGTQKIRFLDLLAAAETSRQAQLEVRQELQAQGSMTFALIKAEVYRARATTALARLDLGGENLIAWRNLTR